MKKIHHFILKNFFPTLGEQNIIDKNIIHQIIKVLNLKVGEEIIINDGKGKALKATILHGNQNNLVIHGNSINTDSLGDRRFIRLYCSILKADHFEWVVEKATELGAQEIIPLITARTIKTNIRQERLEKIAQEAAEQCERGVIPSISPPAKFVEVMNNTFNKNTAFIFDMNGQSFLSSSLHKNTQEISLFIGPEGGWTDKELAQAKEYNLSIVSLGNTILRAETAAVVSCFWASGMLK